MSVQWTNEVDQEFSEYFFDPGEDERESDDLAPARGIMNGLILSLFFWVPILIWFWRTR